MQMNDPLYMTALGAPWGMPIPPEQDKFREYLYIHLWVTFWQTFYVIGMMPESQLRRACERELFHGRPGREYWEHARNTRSLYTKDRRARRFEQILEEEYMNAITSQPDCAPSIIASQAPQGILYRDKHRSAKAVGTLLAAAATGALVDRLVNSRT
jgi:hypothetical protein